MSVSGILAIDESTSGRYVTAGGVYIDEANIRFVLSAISDLKKHYGIPTDAEIHCRELFAGDRRRKTAFKHVEAKNLIPFLMECVWRTKLAGCSWYATYCDMMAYPQKFSMFEGDREYDVTAKHIANLLVGSMDLMIETMRGGDYVFIYDRDSTKLDYGRKSRMQATGYASLSPRSQTPSTENKPLLELADLAAYAYGRALSALIEPDNEKLTRFIPLVSSMGLHAWTTGYPADGDTAIPD